MINTDMLVLFVQHQKGIQLQNISLQQPPRDSFMGNSLIGSNQGS